MSRAKTGDLEIQIEELVREHIAGLRRAATAAVEHAFGRAGGRKVKRGGARPAGREAGHRRAPEEVAALGEQLYAAIYAHPGAAMTQLAAVVGATPRELNRPVTQLKRAGRVRTVGRRQGMRYFPMSAKTGSGRS